MTREEAIQILSTRDRFGVPCGHTSGYGEALDMAIEALQTLEAVERIKTEVLPQTDFVRCKDCDRKLGSTECPCCTKEYHINEETFYCAWGERREE